MPKSLSRKVASSCAVAFGLLSFGINAQAATITWAYTAQITDSNLEFPSLFPPVPSYISGTFSFDSAWIDSNTNVTEAKYQGIQPSSISASISGQEFVNTSGNVIEVFDQGGGVFVSLLRTSAATPSTLDGNARYSGVINIFLRDDNGDAPIVMQKRKTQNSVSALSGLQGVFNFEHTPCSPPLCQTQPAYMLAYRIDTRLIVQANPIAGI